MKVHIEHGSRAKETLTIPKRPGLRFVSVQFTRRLNDASADRATWPCRPPVLVLGRGIPCARRASWSSGQAAWI
eukprot:scaffold177858_cov16-Prasinocladus_malaysianus.AAC.1